MWELLLYAIVKRMKYFVSFSHRESQKHCLRALEGGGHGEGRCCFPGCEGGGCHQPASKQRPLMTHHLTDTL